ncbi:MAG: hypothetical protein Q8R60_17600 [Mycobacteriales bacterium]|nr:hypothetical protein [Mycobacteriales bacterium]
MALPRPGGQAVRRVSTRLSIGLVLGAVGGWLAGLLKAPRRQTQKDAP